MDEFVYTLKLHIIVGLGLEDIKPEDIDDYAPLFGKGLGLDSIDALDLAWIIKKQYGIMLKDFSEAYAVFQSIAVLAEYIQKNITKQYV
ncbi:MAG: acyl carrier protein [Bacteroidales bacterium]|nr:acyl carrier protein [Bacteroidales bacterium]